MSIHIGAKPGDIAKTVLLPGDPWRAKWAAENFLNELVCYSEVRGMLGFTGIYNGKRVSIQGTGMGIPSMAIYVNELIDFYKAKRLIRIGSCGALLGSLQLGEVIIGHSALTDSAVIKRRRETIINCPTFATKELVKKAERIAAEKLKIPTTTGLIYSTDEFYQKNSDEWEKWVAKGAIAVEMETAVLYLLGAEKKIETLSINTVSDNLVTGEKMSAKQRQTSFEPMLKLALSLIK